MRGCIKCMASRQSFPKAILRLGGGGLLKTRHLSAPRKPMGIVVPVSSPAFVFVDNNHSTNSADTHHALYCIIIFMGIVYHILIE